MIRDFTVGHDLAFSFESNIIIQKSHEDLILLSKLYKQHN